MMQLTVANVLEATQGRLAQGDAAALLTGVSTSSITVQPGDLFVALPGEKFDGHTFVKAALEAGAAAAIVSREIDGLPAGKALVRVHDTLAAYQALGGWWRAHMPARVAGITGSNGKTTTKEMLAHLLGSLGDTLWSEGNHNNHVGVPETLLRIRPEHRFAVVELGANHFGEIPPIARIARPHVGIITNIGPTHLEAFGSEEGVAREKSTMLGHLVPGGLAVLHADEPWSREIAQSFAGRKVTFGFSRGADWRAVRVRQAADHVRFAVERTGDVVTAPVVGRWQVANCLAAMAAAAEMGLSVAEAAARLRDFRGPKWRMEIRRAGALTLLLDCYNANLASMLGAIGELGRRRGRGRRVAVLGDMLELGATSLDAHRAVGRAAAEAGIGLLCAVGPEAAALAAEAVAHGMRRGSVHHTADRQEAARWLCGQLEALDEVLFKGSRGMRLEEVADAVIAWAEHGGESPAASAGAGADVLATQAAG